MEPHLHPQPAGQQDCWSYDSFGNRLGESLSTTPCASVVWPAPSSVFNAANQYATGNPQGIVYDAAGNVQTDGVNAILYDAEGRVCADFNSLTTSLEGYIYNADGARVAKGTVQPVAGHLSCDLSQNQFAAGSLYVLGPGGEQLTETDGSGNWVHTNVFAAGSLLATYSATGLSYQFSDWLGTKRVQVDTANVANPESCQSLPFGNGLSCSGPTDATEHHFTGKERDAESGLDNFGARYFGSNMGRFMSPDWADFPDAVPWANTDNPQSLNLYSYVLNNPLSDTDPDGHDCVVQSRTSNTTETVTTSAGNCDNVSVGDGQTKTYVPGTVTGISVNGSGTIDIGYNSYDGESSGVVNANSAPIPNNPGLAYNWGNNAQGYQQLGAASRLVKGATVGYAVVFGAVGAGMVAADIAAGQGLTTLAGENGFDMMGSRALNRAIGDAQRKILDDLFLGKGGGEGLTQRTIKIYIEISERAIAAGKDSLGVQAARVYMLKALLK